MAINLKGNGMMAYAMEKVSLLLMMAKYLKAVSIMENYFIHPALEFCRMNLEFMLARFKVIRDTAKENYTLIINHY